MNYIIELLPEAQEHLLIWQKSDKAALKRIRTLFANMQETPYSGIGKPEVLRYELSGMYSRRIDKKNRIVCEVDDIERIIYVHQLRDHY